jgi:hypothetical protein
MISVPNSGINGNLSLTDATGQNGLYSLIVMTSPIIYQDAGGAWKTVITSDQNNAIKTYQSTFNVRLVVLNDSPDDMAGVVSHSSAPWGTGVNQLIAFAPNSSPYANAAGLQSSLTASTSGLWHTPCVIKNSSIAKPVLNFLPDTTGTFKSETVAAALISMNGRQQLSFYFSAATWSTTTMLFGHMWLAWGTRGLYSGFRRIAFSTQVDDLFLFSLTNASLPRFRLSADDMTGIHKWQLSINQRMNKGSNFKVDLVFNGNGVYEYSKLFGGNASASLNPLKLESAAEVSVDYVKPLSEIGNTFWPAGPSSMFNTANFIKDVPQLKTFDPLFAYFVKNVNNFYLGSHTWSHEIMNNISLNDARNENTATKQFAQVAGFANSSSWSSRGMVTPGISGVFNGDALLAISEAGWTSITGDNSRKNLLNTTNEFWPYVSTKAINNFDGMVVIPRYATRVYFNCSTTSENVLLHGNMYPNQKGLQFSDILNQDTQQVVANLMTLKWDAYMFHQANLRNADLTSKTSTIVGPFLPLSNNRTGGSTAAYKAGKLGLLQAWTESIVGAYNQLVTWPMITYKLDDLADLFTARAIRENSGISVVAVNTAGNISAGFNGLVVLASKSDCVAPVTFPAPVNVRDIINLNPAWKTERVGTDSLTLWVPLVKGVPVNIRLSQTF